MFHKYYTLNYFQVKFLMPNKIFPVLALLLIAIVIVIRIKPDSKIDYSSQVKPIFNRKCITCHGGVKQKGGFSLLFRDEALANTKSGKPAIIPGKPSESELIRRVVTNDPDARMPYKHPALTDGEIKILKQWISEGAEWGEHWAYVPLKHEPVPDLHNKWILNDIDEFIGQKLKEENLSPSKEADKATLLRRVSLDITGLPPTETESSKFLSDNSPKAYENLVDSLLASPKYGERWTSLWLDLARYADTKGYEKDGSRNIWKYRDWLIRAFNSDKPYNEFLMEQIAGDLMPDPDDAKYTATAFHRNTMTNDEGGTDNEEFRTAAVLDRVNTTWGALMGTTFNCVQCHSHPYDPFKQEEYYKFMAFFNNSRDEDSDLEYPLLRNYNQADSLKLNLLVNWLTKNVSASEAKRYYTFLKTWQPSINTLKCDNFVNGALLDCSAGLRNKGTCRLTNVNLGNKDQLMFRYYTSKSGGNWTIYLDSLKGPLLKTIPLLNKKNKGSWQIATVELPIMAGKHDLYFKFYNPGIVNPDETGVMFDWLAFGTKFPGKGKPGFETALNSFNELMRATIETIPIMVENIPDQFRTTHVFVRGNRLVEGNEVTPDVPHILNPLPKNAPKNRLGLAMWLTDPKNPLVARTMVNRLWEQLFGYGLAETLEDLGSQGIPPTHKELLDHLSWQFIHDFNWSMKKVLKEIVLSATYRQDSRVNEELLKKDPNNKFYARGPRVRLSAEQIRDQGLAVSNLLSSKMYGKSVMPFQPEGIWRSPYSANKWKISEGEDQFRRAVYTYWKRTAPYPSMITFDGGAREVCITRRIRTNTPLQALTILNDSTYLVIARSLASRMNESGGGEITKKIAKGYELMMYKPITETKLNALIDLYNKSFAKFTNDIKGASQIEGRIDQKGNVQSASLVMVAGAMLNIDEWLNKN